MRRKFAQLRTQTRLQVAQNKQTVTRRFNTKAFINLTITICLFTLLVFPVAGLQFYLVISDVSTENVNIFWLETLCSISFSSVYVAYPVVTSLADKEIKRTIAIMLRRICDDNVEASDDVFEAHGHGAKL